MMDLALLVARFAGFLLIVVAGLWVYVGLAMYRTEKPRVRYSVRRQRAILQDLFTVCVGATFMAGVGAFCMVASFTFA